MNAQMKMFFAALFLVCLGLAGAATAQDTHIPTLATNPSRPPANQQFAATFYFVTNPASVGFWDQQHPTTVINGNVVTFGFDTGCGFLCPPGNPTYTAFPFTMPALPAGTYVVRFASDPNSSSAVYGEFTLDVGLGAVTPTALPIGGYASGILGLLILVLGWKYLRARDDV